MEVDASRSLPISTEHTDLFFDYLAQRDRDFEVAADLLRTEEEALAYCERIGADVTSTRTRSQDHHQSSAAMVAAVSYVAGEYCLARNLDGAIPSLDSPEMVWEIKEYWGKTKGGSKMSDAVYECALVGRELREFEERSGADPVSHIVFLDGAAQWSHRQSDLKRFMDLFHQGFIDHLIVGREVETGWEELLRSTFP